MKRNGTWKIVATVGSFLIVIIAAAITYGALHEKVSDMEPNVAKNSEHRIRFEERFTSMDTKVTNMDVKIDMILKAVKEVEEE